VVYFVLVQRQQPTMVVSAKLCLAPFAFQKSLVFARCKLFFCCSSSSAGIKFSLRRSVGQERRRLLVGWSLAFLQLIQPCVLHTEQKQERKPFKRSRSAKTHLYQAGERNRASAYKSELARRKANGGAGGRVFYLSLAGIRRWRAVAKISLINTSRHCMPVRDQIINGTGEARPINGCVLLQGKCSQILCCKKRECHV
jgi:hypothetical protein